MEKGVTNSPGIVGGQSKTRVTRGLVVKVVGLNAGCLKKQFWSIAIQISSMQRLVRSWLSVLVAMSVL